MDSIQATSDDATEAKFSASSNGYYSDPYIRYFVKRPSRKEPIINLGYYARVSVIDQTVIKFLESDESPKQIVSVGSGNDTLYFRIPELSKSHPRKFVELDYGVVTRNKIDIITKHEAFYRILGVKDRTDAESHVISSGMEFSSDKYSIVNADLRDLEDVKSKLMAAGLDPSIPTLFIAECVLIYLKETITNPFLSWIASAFPKGVFFLYEQINPSDPFGRMMIENLVTRGCPLMSISAYPTLKSQVDRFFALGWKQIQGFDMLQYVTKCLSREEISRVYGLEPLDEFEEWNLIQKHYFALVASVYSEDSIVFKDTIAHHPFGILQSEASS